MIERSRTVVTLHCITGFLVCSFILLLMAAQPVAARGRSSVTVRNDNFEVIHVVTDQRSMSVFWKLWNAKQKISSQKIIPHWLYKLDLTDGSRWLYDPRGYTMLVSTKKVPMYRVSPANKFNRLINVHP